MSTLLGLGQYDSPLAPDEATPAAQSEDDGLPEAEAGDPSTSAIQLSIVDYENDPDERADDETAQGDALLGVTLDDEAVHKAARKRVGVGGVQISVVKKPASKAPAGSIAAPATTPSEDGMQADLAEQEAGRPAFVIPGSPPGEVDSKLTDKFMALVSKTREGYSVNEHIRNAQSFRNPDILEKLVAFFDVRECGTNYPPALYDPNDLGKDEYYDQLEEIRRKLEERQARKPGEKVAFSSAGVSETASTAAPQAKPRKSKWDTSSNASAEPAAKRQQSEA